MTPVEWTLLILTLVFGFYMAWNIGANDVANAMGTSVGSGALTLKRAVILAAVLEFAGAFLVGQHVSDTVRKGIINPEVFADEPMVLAYGMIASLLAAGIWLQIASYFGWPVSTTHSIVGAIVGFAAVFGGVTNVDWSAVGTIVASWVISPAISGFLAFIFFRIVLHTILFKPDPTSAAKKATPVWVFLVLTVLSLVLMIKGMKHYFKAAEIDLPLGTKIAISLLVGLVAAGVGAILVWRMKIKSNPMPETYDLYVARSLEKVQKQLRRIRNATTEDTREVAQRMLDDSRSLYETVKQRVELQPRESQFREVERIFVYLQILSACFVAFAHGSNDVANAIGPLSAAVDIIRSGTVAASTTVPTWALALGGVGIVIGLATWGWRVIETVGRRITELTPTRGFCAEFAAATTIVVASVCGLPISTTHTLVGAVLGVGLARGIAALNLNVVRDVVVSWIVTIPAGAGMSIVFFLVLRAVFG